MRKRTVALLFLALVLSLGLAALALVRTPWAGERVCRAAAGRLGSDHPATLGRHAPRGVHTVASACGLGSLPKRS